MSLGFQLILIEKSMETSIINGNNVENFFFINILNLKHLKAYIMITLTLPMQK